MVEVGVVTSTVATICITVFDSSLNRVRRIWGLTTYLRCVTRSS